MTSLDQENTSQVELWIQTYADRIVFWSLIVLTVVLPLILNPYGHSPAEVPKLFILRVLTIAAIAAWFARSLAFGKIEWQPAPLNLPWLIFLGAALISTILSAHLHTSVYGEIYRYEGVLTLANYAILYFFAVNYLRTEGVQRTWLNCLVIVAGIISVLGIMQGFGLPVIASSESFGSAAFGSRSFATFGNPLYLGAFLTLTIPLTLSFLLIKMDEQDKAETAITATPWYWLITIVIGLQLGALLLTLGRAAWLGLAIGLVVFLVISRTKIARYYRQLALSLVIIIILPLFILRITSLSSTSSEITESVSKRALSTFQSKEETASNRIYMWKMSLGMIAARPIFGYGLDSYLISFPRFRPSDWYKKITEEAIPDKAHNAFLQVAVDQGIVGLVAYLALILILFLSLISRIRKSKDDFQRFFLVGVLSAAIGYFIQLQFNFSATSVAPIFWLMIGSSMSRAESDPESRPRTIKIRFLDSDSLRTAGYIIILVLSGYLLITIVRPLLSDCYIMSGNKKLAAGYSDAAIVDFEKALALNGREIKYYLFLKDAYMEKYKSTRNQADAQQLLEVLNQAEALNPYWTEIYFGRGNLFREMAQGADRNLLTKAIKDYKKVLEFDPNNRDAYYNIGLIYFDLQDYDAAISNWQKTVELDPRDEEAYTGLGESLMREKRFGEAKQAFNTALRINPENAQAKKRLEELTQ